MQQGRQSTNNQSINQSINHPHSPLSASVAASSGLQGGIVTVETRAGEVYRGVLDEAEDNMNLILKVRVRWDWWRLWVYWNLGFAGVLGEEMWCVKWTGAINPSTRTEM